MQFLLTSFLSLMISPTLHLHLCLLSLFIYYSFATIFSISLTSDLLTLRLRIYCHFLVSSSNLTVSNHLSLASLSRSDACSLTSITRYILWIEFAFISSSHIRIRCELKFFFSSEFISPSNITLPTFLI